MKNPNLSAGLWRYHQCIESLRIQNIDKLFTKVYTYQY